MRRLFTTTSFLILSLCVSAQIQNQKDDPQARMEFEFMRTKNPVTNQIPDGIKMKERALMDQRQQLFKSRIDPLALAPPSTTWENRGPFNVGGRTRALAIDLTDATEQTILAGGVSGGLWRTTDGGTSWNKMTTFTDLQSITCIAQDVQSTDGLVWYYGTGEWSGNSAGGSGAPYRGDGVFKSTDGGSTWSLLAVTSTESPESFDQDFDYNHEIVVNPTNGDVIVANYGGIYRSTDGGASFSQVLTGQGGLTDVAVTSTGILYAVKNFEGAGVWRSIDGGDNWTDITHINHSFAPGERKEIAIAPSNEDIIYVLGEDATETSEHSLWKFDDATDTWTDLSANIPQLGGLTGDFDSQGGYDLLIKVKNDDPDFVIIGGTNLFASSDGFSSTSNTNWIGGYTSSNDSYALYLDHHPDQHSFIFLDGNRAYSGNDGGVQLTSDVTASTVSWTPLNNGYLTAQIYAVSAGPEDQLLIGLQDNGTWFADNSTTSTDEWTDAWGGDGAYSAINSDGTIRFLSSQNANLTIWNFSSADDPTATSAWFFKPPAPGEGESNTSDNYQTGLFITPFYLDPQNNNLFYLAGDFELWVNTQAVSADNQNGASVGWKPIATGVAGIVSEIGIGSDEVIYAGTSSGNVVKVTNASDENPTIEDVTGANFPGGYVSGISVNPINNDRVLVTFSNYEIPSVFYTNDGGISWTDVSGNLEENMDGSGSGPSVRIGRIHGNDFKFFVGTSTGLYSTDLLDGTNTQWIREGEDEIGATVVEHMITRLDGLVVAATHGNGVYSATVPFFDTDLMAESIDELEDGVFTESETVIKATVQNLGNLSISDYDILLYVDNELVVTDNVTETIDNLSSYQHTFTTTYDFSTSGAYEVRVEVSVSGDEDISNNEVSLEVVSLAVPSDITLSNNTIAEMDAAGTLIGTLDAVDEDDDTHTFSLVSGDGSDDNDDFVISGTELKSDAVFDFETKAVYTIRIQTEDNDGNSFAKSFEISISDVTAVAEWEEAGVTVYPNPSKGRITVEMINDYIGDVSVKIFDLNGKEVLSQESYPKSSKSTRSLLDISNLDHGTYFVKFNFGGREITSRLIKE
ncbi:T9SS type A sorting domain-containing protein [Ekhidna sp.]|uniref:T9SS type A sorting domain-containing protein n=1 Tax=Ekhidna sp. TaxID=2608089 RepID=UPI003C7D19F8